MAFYDATPYIPKEPGSLTLSAYEVTLTLDTPTATITATGTGSITASSSNPSICTVSVSGNTITISAVNPGEATVKVISRDTPYYDWEEKEIYVDYPSPILGVEWANTNRSVALTRTDAAANLVDPVPYYSGMEGTPSSPFDNIAPWSQISIVEDSSAGTLVKIPKFWYKWTRTSTTTKLQISAKQVEGFNVSPAHMDRGDGAGERDFAYIGRYHCASTFKSTTGVAPLGRKNMSQFRVGIQELGTDIWMSDFAMWWTIRMLYLVEFANWDSQASIGYGCSLDSSAPTAVYAMGYTDNMPYHTGTVATSRSSYGGTQYRYIEGLWDNICDYIAGIFTYSSDIYAIKDPTYFGYTDDHKTKVGTRSSTMLI